MEKPVIIVCATAYRPFIGGAEIAIEETARRLAGDFDFVIVTARMSRDLARMESGREGMIVRLGWGSAFDKWMLPFLTLWSVPALIKKSYGARRAVLWGMDISQGSLAALVLGWRTPKVPFVLTVQYGESEARLAAGRMGLVARAFRAMLMRADAVTAISAYLARVVRAHGFAGPLETIPNGVDLGMFRHQGAKTHGHRIVTVSRLVPKNGVDILIRAVAEVKKTVPDVKCLIIGDGPERKKLEALAGELGLADAVSFPGSIAYEKLPAYLHESDVFVRPSRSEGMGNAFVEALAAGVPVIGTRVGGIPDIIEDGKTGFFARGEDAADCAEKIIGVFRNPVFADATVREGAEKITDRFEWDAIARRYRGVFLNLIRADTAITIATGLFPPDIGGPATYSHTLVGELPPHGIRVRVSYFGAVRRLPRIIRHFVFFFRTLAMARGSDVIFAQDPVSVGLPALYAARMLGAKFLLKVVGDYAWEQEQVQNAKRKVENEIEFETPEAFQTQKHGILTEMRRRIERHVARGADRIIVPSRYLAGIVGGWGIAREKITTVYNAFEAPSPLPSRADARAMLGLSGTVVISAGRLVPWKGFSVLIDAVADLKKEMPDLNLVIAGSGPDEEKLRHKISERGAGDRVRMTGVLSHETLLSYFSAADIFVLNSGYEGLSHTLLEAVALGLPVIASRVGGNPEVVTDETRGILIGYNDLDELKAALGVLAAGGRTRVQAPAWPYTRERMIKATAEIIKKL